MNNGAWMLPAFCPANAVAGEREVFRSLQNDSGASGWVVLHSLDLAEHIRQVRSEADFVVLIPGEGIVVLEVKSHHSIRFDEKGWWLGNALEPEPRGPFRQAAEAMHSVWRYLDQKALADSIPMISAVVFPFVQFSFSSPEWHSWQVLDRQSLHSKPISANLLYIIRQARRHLAAKGLRWTTKAVETSPEKWNRIAKVLRPRFETLASPAARRKSLDDDLLYCTEQQFRFLDNWSENDRMLVSGLAGTGKTILAIEALRREKATNPTRVIGFFCFNKLLGKRLEVECQGLGESVRVGHFHQWMTTLGGIVPGRQEASSPEFWKRTLPEKVLGILTSPGLEGGFLDYLVLDEAQDLFLEPYLDIFDLLLKGGLQKGRWLFMGDFERQSIYSSGAISKMEFCEQRVQKQCALFKLDENCRNTREISNAMTMLACLKPGYAHVLREDTRHDPEFHFYSEDQEQETLASTALDQLLGEGFKPRDIVLLSPYREKALGQRLSAYPSWKTRLKEYRHGTEVASHCTIQAFKGLEAPVVILTDIRDLDDAKRIDLFYIGMSRALHRLIVLCHESAKASLKEMLL
jgi:Nuclease-related domain/UvrD-like helicase C-terminal domain